MSTALGSFSRYQEEQALFPSKIERTAFRAVRISWPRLPRASNSASTASEDSLASGMAAESLATEAGFSLRLGISSPASAQRIRFSEAVKGFPSSERMTGRIALQPPGDSGENAGKAAIVVCARTGCWQVSTDKTNKTAATARLGPNNTTNLLARTNCHHSPFARDHWSWPPLAAALQTAEPASGTLEDGKRAATV